MSYYVSDIKGRRVKGPFFTDKKAFQVLATLERSTPNKYWVEAVPTPPQHKQSGKEER